MNVKERIFLISSIVTCLLLKTEGADKYTDGNRPYEFGFSIDGEQHRHEKKDEKGLIEGEFGFITADGVYHVTVYATDEQGRFKILSMKNIRVKPYPTYTAKQSNTSARQGHSLDLPAEQPAVSSSVSTTTFKAISIQPPANSCSHCSIPTTPTPAPPVPAFNQPPNSNPNQIATVPNPRFPQGIKPETTFGNQENGVSLPSPLSPQPAFGGVPTLSGVSNYPLQSQNNLPQTPLSQSLTPPQNFQNIPQQNIPQQGFGASQSSLPGINNLQENQPKPGSSNFPQGPITPTFSQALPQSPDNYQNVLQTNQVSENAINSPNSGRGTFSNDRTAKKLDLQPQIGLIGSQPNSLQRGVSNNNEKPTKPTLISAQMQIVDKNTDIYRRGPGENDGLPEGLTKNDMSRLLYTFNYTVGFHGHFEEGYTDGVKQGYYLITGRNGVRTRVDYISDSTGFHPKISQEVLDLLSDDVPKPETEKEEKFGLKGYEFKWLYYPVEAKGR